MKQPASLIRLLSIAVFAALLLLTHTAAYSATNSDRTVKDRSLQGLTGRDRTAVPSSGPRTISADDKVSSGRGETPRRSGEKEEAVQDRTKAYDEEIYPEGTGEEPVAGEMEGAAVEEEEPPSVFEEYASEILGEDIEQFGYSIFKKSSYGFIPDQALPVGPDYILGPGDELRISLWGKLEGDYVLEIDRGGLITIPELGALHIAGLTYGEAKGFLAKELSRYYRASEVKMNVGMGSLRTMSVYVVGKVKRPGSYTVSSLSTMINALFEAGGLDKSGSMRDIRLKRGGETVSRLDLYDLLLKGDKTADVRLMPEDVIFVPPHGPLVAVSGNVNTPAIYELRGETTVAEALEFSGGLNDIAFRKRLQIFRIGEDSREKVFESTLDEAATRGLGVRGGDLLKVFTVVPDRSFVRLSGAVMVEGEYGVGEDLTVKGLLEMAGGLQPYAYADEAELTRVRPTPEGPETEKIFINVGKALEGDPAHDIRLRRDDYLFIRSIPEWDPYRTVTIEGEVRFPGTYAIRKGETISSVIERAGGFTDRAYLKGVVFTRESVRELQQMQLDESIDRLEHQLLTTTAQTIEEALTPAEAQQQVAAMAQRKALIAKLRSVTARGRIAIRMHPYEKFKGSEFDQPLDDGDTLTVPERPAQVQVMGSVYNQTAFVFNSDATVSRYIKMAGGLTSDADKSEIYILKVDGTAVSKRLSRGRWNVSWDRGSKRWLGGGIMGARLDPGDTIVVPEDMEKILWLKEFKDITQILYQVAVTAGVLIVAF